MTRNRKMKKEIVISGTSRKVGECTAGLVGRVMDRVTPYRNKVDNLNTKIEELLAAQKRLQDLVAHEAKKDRKKIKADVVQEWLSRAPGIAEEAKKWLQQAESKANSRCLSLSFPNLLSQLKLSREVMDMVQKVTSEIEMEKELESKFFGSIQDSIKKKRDYKVFESRSLISMEIMEALRDPNVRVIGLYGMAGTGKTMMAKEVCRQALMEEELFSESVLLTLSPTPKKESLLEETVKQLKLKFKESDFSVRVDRLRQCLRRKKNVLIIVDDVWQRFDMDDAGISFRKFQKQCKIFLISRFRGVLCNMGAEKNFHVGTLSESESVKLCNTIVGDSAAKIEFQPLATEIVQKCAGLPLAITEMLGEALDEKSRPSWKSFLQELKMSDNPDNIITRNETMYQSIKLNYEILEGEEAKSLLLLCSLFPEDASISIERLLIYGMVLGSFQGIETFEQARSKVLMLIKDLKNHGLLMLDVNNSKSCVKLHNVIRCFCLRIASRDRRWYTIRNVDDETIEESLENNIERLQDPIATSLLFRLETPQLLLLSCDAKHEKAMQIPDLFFQGMKDVRVLDLSGGLHGNQLPSSFCHLENLRALCLRGCKLRDIALIGKLKNLEILDLSFSKNVEKLGREIAKLIKLRSLNLNYCANLRVIHPNVIRSLTSLEVLAVANGFTDWEVEGEVEKGGRNNASLSELKDLHRLTTLDLCIPDIYALPEDIFKLIGEKLERYYIVLGMHHSEAMNICLRDLNVASRGLELNLYQYGNVLDKYGLRDLLKKGCAVISLDALDGQMNYIVYELDKDNCLSQCKHLQVKHSYEIHLVEVKQSRGPSSVFRSLKSLCLINLWNLKSICFGKLTSDSFGKLRRIQVSECHSLENLFPFPIAKRQLEEIEVSDCKKIKEIFKYEGERDDAPGVDNNQVIKIEFPRLRVLRLKKLRNLQQYCAVSAMTKTASHHMPLFNQKVVLSNCEELHLQGINVESIWGTDKFEGRGFHNLTTLIVNYCHKMKTVMPSSIATSLVHLKTMRINECNEVEEVITEESGERRLGKILLPKLEILELYKHWKLKRFYAGDHIKCPSLVELHIIDCYNMKTFINDVNSVGKQQPFFNQKVVIFSKLQKLIVESNKCVNAIWHDEEQMQALTNLEVLRLRGLPELMNLYCKESSAAIETDDRPKLKYSPLIILMTSSMTFRNLKSLSVIACNNRLTNLMDYSTAKSLQQLEDITIYDCCGMTEIIGHEDETAELDQSDDHYHDDEFVFSQLYAIRLYGMNNLKSFYSGKNTISFPSLKMLMLGGCNNMKSFCGGTAATTVKTPMLDKILFALKQYPKSYWYSYPLDEAYQQCLKSGEHECRLLKGDINATFFKFWEDHHHRS